MFNARGKFSSCGLQASVHLQDNHRVGTLTVPNSSVCFVPVIQSCKYEDTCDYNQSSRVIHKLVKTRSYYEQTGIRDTFTSIWCILLFILLPETVVSFFMCAVCTEYVALYSYSSTEPGDLTFTEGEEILVTQKEGEWWTGSIDGRTGIFPCNYVRPKDQEVSSYSKN